MSIWDNPMHNPAIEEEKTQARDHIIEQERTIVGQARRIKELEADSELLAEVRAIVQKSPRLYRSTQVWQLLGDPDA